jgi:hypothetical protein
MCKKKIWYPYDVNIVGKLWWVYMPGVIINVRWPGYGSLVFDESSDPNEQYRPWLERHVGRQGWDWDWGIGSEDRLIIKIRQKYAKYATIAALRWL